MLKMKKVMTIHVESDAEKEEFLRELQKARLPAPIYVHGKLNSIRISIQGTKGDIRETSNVISAIHRKVRSKFHPNRRGLYRYDLEELTGGIPTSTLLTLLRITGEKFEVDPSGKILTTSVPWEEMTELVRELSRVMADIAPETTRQIREVVIPVAVAFNVDPMEVLDALIDAGAAEWKEDKFKYELVKNKEQALELILKGDRFKYKPPEGEEGD
ncbi:MAG: DUF2067 domain-containing protein [Thermococci archaeon]|nr:DUF2067 domain-containing protein [Thermococci archaeon]